MLKYVAKISMDIFPSVLATIIGAYIVNHYINAKPAPDAPAAVASPAHPRKDGKPAEIANLPAPGVKAKGISEKSVSEKASAEKAPTEKAATEKAGTEKAAAEKAADKPAEAKTVETNSVEPSRSHPASRDKTLAKATPVPTISAPAVAVPATEAAPIQDANDLARAAIERLRRSPEKSLEAAPRETAHAAEPPRIQEAPRVANAAPEPLLRPLPPPITVSTPGPEAYGPPGGPSNPPYTASVGSDDSNRLTPPADIPVPVVIAPPLDLRADASGAAPPRKANVADEMLSNVKSMFHSVLPKGVTPD